MTIRIGDVDVDVTPGFDPRSVFAWTRASVSDGGVLKPHPCGYYPHEVPTNPLDGGCAVAYGEAEELGAFKIDFLTNHVYSHFSNREEIDELLRTEPNWDLLLVLENQPKIFHLSKHGDLIDRIKPRSVEEVADIMALIRPGKRGLLALYEKDRGAARRLLYAQREDDAYAFKKSHSFAYALVVVLQLHLIELELL